MKPFESNKLQFTDVFSESRFYQVPSYQRRYSWGSDEFEDLIDDLSGADFNAEYFLGLLIMHKRSSSEYDVVDGQQRLVTLSILAACLRDVVLDEDYKKSLRKRILQEPDKALKILEKIRVAPKEDALLSQVIVEDGSTRSLKLSAAPTDTEKRYEKACKIFHEKLSAFSQDQVESFISFLLSGCTFIVITTDDLSEALRLFTITNDRGRQLRRVDILKTENLDQSYVSSDSKRQKLAIQWEEYEDALGDSDFEQFFSVARLMFVKGKPQRDLLREFNDRIFQNSSLNIKRGEPFFIKTFNLLDIYKSIFVDFDYYDSSDHKEVNAFNALVYIMSKNANSFEWKSVILLFADKFGKECIFDFVLSLEKFLLELWVKSVRKDERFDRYGTLLSKVESAKTAKEAIDAVLYDDVSIKKAAQASDLYKPSYGKYMLLRLELLASELDQPRWIDAKSVEHVLPQSPKSGSDWLKSHDSESLDAYVHSIGNLVLLSKSKNSAAKNYEFSKKKDVYLKQRVSDYPRSIEVLALAEWTKDVIEMRTKEAATKLLDDPRAS